VVVVVSCVTFFYGATHVDTVDIQLDLWGEKWNQIIVLLQFFVINSHLGSFFVLYGHGETSKLKEASSPVTTVPE